MTHKEVAQWADRRMRLRSRISKILLTLREDGTIDSIDLDRLHNYCMVMLMVLAKVSPGTLDAAIKSAEIAALLKDQVEDFSVILDEDLYKGQVK